MQTIGKLKFFGGNRPVIWSVDQKENEEIVLRSPSLKELPVLKFSEVKKMGNRLHIEDVQSGTTTRFNMVKVLENKELQAKFPMMTTIGVVNVRIVYCKGSEGKWFPTVNIRKAS